MVTPAADAAPDEQVVLAGSVGLALLVVLDSLTPSERLAFVLHDVFAVPFREIGQILGKTTDATKMVASRARRKVQATHRPVGPGREQLCAAALGGDFVGVHLRPLGVMSRFVAALPRRRADPRRRPPHPLAHPRFGGPGPTCSPGPAADDDRAAACVAPLSVRRSSGSLVRVAEQSAE